MARAFRFKFVVLGRYPARIKGNESHVTVNMEVGPGQHLVHAGTLTMSEDEWAAFVGALRYSLRDSIELVDPGRAETAEVANRVT